MLRRNKKFFWRTITVLLLSMVLLFAVVRFFITPVVVDDAASKAQLQAQLIEKELSIKFSEQAALTKNLATIASNHPLNLNSFIASTGVLIENSTNIAGGGIWPEPNKLIADREKASLFWVKTEDGEYELDPGYNTSQDNAYQNERWYQNAKQALPNQCVWSNAYIDPHSGISMVTCSVRIDRDDAFWGVATIDVDLTDIEKRLASIKQQSGVASVILDSKEQIVATSLHRDYNLLMHTIDEAAESDTSLKTLFYAFRDNPVSYAELDSAVLGSESSIMVVTGLSGQHWHIGVIFPDSIARKQINVLNNYLYFFIVSLAFGFTAVTLITASIGYWNIKLIGKVKSKSRELVAVSLKDTLTGLPNQSGLFEELEQRIQIAKESPDSKFAILILDLDDFKIQNDRFGLAGGDQLLSRIASRLKSAIRPSDYICRFGGDEFVVVTQITNDKHDAESVCAHLLNTIKEPFLFEGKDVFLTMSVGIACYSDDGVQVNELLRNASIAKRDAKDVARNSFSFSSKDMNKRTLRKVALEEQMKDAIERGEVSVAFQPIVELESSQPLKFEALARWSNPELGAVPPDEFIALAEHNGMILELGEYILTQSLESCRRLRERFGQDYMVAVNVSPKQFDDPQFSSRVMTILKNLSLPASCLTLEITESVLIENRARSEAVIQELSAGGIKIAMDDFGTGYSSLSYIRHYPFNILKIDKEFIDDLVVDPTSMRLVEATLAMANSLGIDVVAEGIEDVEQAEILKQKKCKYAQGYFFARPLNEQALEAWLIESYANK